MKQQRAIIETGFRTVFVKIGKRTYDMNKITESSFQRLHSILSSDAVEKEVSLHPLDLTPTVYCYFGAR